MNTKITMVLSPEKDEVGFWKWELERFQLENYFEWRKEYYL